MSTTYSPTAALPPTSYTLIADGDDDVVAELAAHLESLSNSTEYVAYNVGDHFATLSPPAENTNTRWTFDFNLMLWVQTDITDAGFLVWPVGFPHRDTGGASSGVITEAHVRIEGDAGPGGAGHANVPSTRPTFRFYRQEGTTLTQLGSTITDAPASAAAYDTAHDLSITGLSEDIITGRNYWAVITGEAGTNSVIDELAIHHIRAVVGAP